VLRAQKDFLFQHTSWDDADAVVRHSGTGSRFSESKRPGASDDHDSLDETKKGGAKGALTG